MTIVERWASDLLWHPLRHSYASAGPGSHLWWTHFSLCLNLLSPKNINISWFIYIQPFFNIQFIGLTCASMFHVPTQILCGGQQDSASSNIDPLLGDLGDELGPNDDGVGQQHPLSEHLEAAHFDMAVSFHGKTWYQRRENQVVQLIPPPTQKFTIMVFNPGFLRIAPWKVQNQEHLNILRTKRIAPSHLNLKKLSKQRE